MKLILGDEEIDSVEFFADIQEEMKKYADRKGIKEGEWIPFTIRGEFKVSKKASMEALFG